MEINTTYSRDVPGAKTITIHLDERDDPINLMEGLVMRGRLESWLRTILRPGEHGAQSGPDTLATLTDLEYLGNLTDRAMEEALLRARDQYGWGWGTIAARLDAPRSTVKDKIIRLRQEYARAGIWYDPAGGHTGTPAEAEAAIQAMTASDGE
ncbi:hypothetical protein [Actinomadura macrotermitis]|uniref:Uncharacterized protein n=1 Tax=Actinomadura macrotermitis TaxID=2585200 RepID=A0A7K0CAU0_9ACTN|nr:hypothetical protein [Actinomadura macrotermitis]MQY09894.1 hypothetical protein [Actinomadura macrotermitis]